MYIFIHGHILEKDKSQTRLNCKKIKVNIKNKKKKNVSQRQNKRENKENKKQVKLQRK